MNTEYSDNFENKEKAREILEKTNIKKYISSYLHEEFRSEKSEIEKEKIIAIISTTWNRDDIAILRNYISSLINYKDENFIKEEFDDIPQLADLKKSLIELWSSTYNNINIAQYPDKKEYLEIQNNIDFEIENVIAIIKEKDIKFHNDYNEYIIDRRNLPITRMILKNFYKTKIILKRNSKSSMRWDKEIELTYFYNWRRLIFIKDNWKKIEENEKIDENDRLIEYKINRSKEERKTKYNPDWAKISYNRPLSFNVNLTKLFKNTNIENFQFTIQY